ncbi:diguanylate cyclase (GGDEF)-like protein/PAS domain S-box-containing protein [Chitinivorax tropicus]|uniref:Diguanylate cyclase (GGDEF)-like protein/PAS domain S-box-containing protein n=1 Tax=Chitinivorax tropicus TaxID=714531 RepID=A0A840MRB5_9PROT|nr:diguanylate cyclase [Chitinivorax tropicus]MBB5018753.1 diguanylate cyclase (GGDEF)-like protein/PAS domain S-box-containing protein [Chitinivorax tropicus]
MLNAMRLSLRFSHRLMIVMVLMVLGLSGGYAYLVWRTMDSMANEMERDVNRIMTDQATGFIERLVTTRAALLDAQLEQVASVAGDGAKVMSRHLQRGGALQESLSGLLSALAARDTWAGRVYFLESSTGEVAEFGTGGMQRRVDKGLHSHLLSTTAGLTVPGDIRWTEAMAAMMSHHRLIVAALSPVSDGKRVLGFVAAEIPLMQLAIDSGRDDGFNGHFSFVLDARRRVVAITPVGRSQLDLISMQNQLPTISGSGNVAFNELLGRIAAGDVGVVQVALRGTPRYVAFHPMRYLPWRLVMVVPADAAEAATAPLHAALEVGQRRTLQLIWLGSLGVLLPIGIAGVLLILRMTRPIKLLIDGANQVAAGNYAYRMPAVISGEFRHLAHAFDVMSEKIGQTVSEVVAATNAERTANQRLRETVTELETLNLALRSESQQRKMAEYALRESEGRLKAIVSHAQALIFLKDLQGRYLLANEPLQSLLERGEQQILGKTDADLLPPMVAMQLHRHDQLVINNRTVGEFEENITLGVEPRIFLTSKFLLSDDRGRPYALGGIGTDITVRKRVEAELRQHKENLDRIVEQRTEALKQANTLLALEIEERNRALTDLQESESRYSLLLHNIHDGVIVVMDAHITLANQVMADMLEARGPDQLVGLDMLDRVAPEERDKIARHYASRLQGSPVEAVYESVLVTFGGRRIEVELSVGVTRFRGENGTVVVLRDITQRKAAEQALQKANAELMRMSVVDSLTGLYNRRYLMSTLESALARALRHRTSLAVMMIDVDRFKAVNDTYGHQAGDRVLVQIAKLIQSRTRQGDTAARYGGEELTLLLPETDIASAKALAMALCRLIADTPCQLEDGRELAVSVSIGVAGVPESRAETVSALLALADEALYRAKRLGRNRVELADSRP